MNCGIKFKCEIQALSFPARDLLPAKWRLATLPSRAALGLDHAFPGTESGHVEIYDRKSDIQIRAKRRLGMYQIYSLHICTGKTYKDLEPTLELCIR